MSWDALVKQAECDETKPPVYTWCYITLMDAKGETPEECIKNFVLENQPFKFEPLSCYGFCGGGTCEALVYYSMRAKNTADAGSFVQTRFCFPNPDNDTTVTFPGNDDDDTITRFIINSMDLVEFDSGGKWPIVRDAPKITSKSWTDEETINLVKEFEEGRR